MQQIEKIRTQYMREAGAAVRSWASWNKLGYVRLLIQGSLLLATKSRTFPGLSRTPMRNFPGPFRSPQLPQMLKYIKKPFPLFLTRPPSPSLPFEVGPFISS